MPRTRRIRVSRASLLIGLLPVLLLGAVLLLNLYGAQAGSDTLPAGVRVGGLDLGGKSQAVARAALDGWIEAQQQRPVYLRWRTPAGRIRVWTRTPVELGLGIDAAATLNAASQAAPGGLIGRVADALHGGQTTQVAPQVQVNQDQLDHALREIAQSADTLAQNARIIFLKNGGLGLRHERPGLSVDIPASDRAVQDSWRAAQGQQPAAGSQAPAGSESPSDGSREPAATPAPAVQPIRVDLVAKQSRAAITYNDLKQIDGLLGAFSTTYAVGDRGDNIHLAVRHINGSIVMPGQVFSVNEAVGPRTLDDGFKHAPVIIHGQLVPGIGGGVCQVSSTLYNAVLLSGLRVVDRSNHAFPVHYLPPGRDATVSYGEVDFKFENSTKSPIYLRGIARGGYLAFSIYGHRVPDQEISIYRGRETVADELVETVPDPSLRAGRRIVAQRGHPDIRVTWYRVVRRNGRVVLREPIHSHYRAFATTVLVGTKAARPKPAVRRPVARQPGPPPNAAGAAAPAGAPGPPASPPAGRPNTP